MGTQDAWRAWFTGRLPADLDAHVHACVEREGLLTLFTESAAWCARLQYAVAELDAEVRAAGPSVKRIAVRVLPR